MSLEKMFQVLESLRDTASANAVFGEPQEVEGRLIIPVAQVGIGLGLGFGQGTSADAAGVSEEAEKEPEAQGEGGGSGGGAGARPVAIIEVTPEETTVKPIVDEGKVALAGIALVGGRCSGWRPRCGRSLDDRGSGWGMAEAQQTALFPRL